jgi:phosphoribosyl-ATP pyrophosphohydrolase/phosphoribosyl-AMP cyclohydrolase
MGKDLKFDANGLIPVIAQDIYSGRVLMQAYMNEEALEKTLNTGYMHYFSRSRQQLWKKGETSGHIQKVVCGFADCDGDSLLFKVEQTGAACHTGSQSCFYRSLCGQDGSDYKIIGDLMATIKDRKTNPIAGSYTNYLYDKGQDKILKKLFEECAEVLIAAKNGEKDSLIMELCDLLYHTMVLMSNSGIELSDIYAELARREGRTPDKKYSDSGLADRPDLSKK